MLAVGMLVVAQGAAAAQACSKLLPAAAGYSAPACIASMPASAASPQAGCDGIDTMLQALCTAHCAPTAQASSGVTEAQPEAAPAPEAVRERVPPPGSIPRIAVRPSAAPPPDAGPSLAILHCCLRI